MEHLGIEYCDWPMCVYYGWKKLTQLFFFRKLLYHELFFGIEIINQIKQKYYPSYALKIQLNILKSFILAGKPSSVSVNMLMQR